MFDRVTMIQNTVDAIRTGANGQWLAMARGGAMLHLAHDKTERNKVRAQLERNLQKTGLYTAGYVTKLISQMTIVAERWRWDLPEKDAQGNPIKSFVEALNHGAVDDTKTDLEGLATGSIVQRVRALWQSLNEIKRSGPPMERPEAAPKARKAKDDTAQDGAQAPADTPAPAKVTLTDAVKALAAFEPTDVGLASALADHPALVKALRAAISEIDAAQAEKAVLKAA